MSPPNRLGPDATNAGTETTQNHNREPESSRRASALADDHQREGVQIPPVGPHPGVDVLLVGALLWSRPADATTVLALVADDDIESPALAAVLTAVSRLSGAGKPHGPQLLLDELRRGGELRPGVADQLRAATTCGADPAAAWHYAGAVVSNSLRRRVESTGTALVAAAKEAPEYDLAPHVASATRSIGNCDARLRQLRGEPL